MYSEAKKETIKQQLAKKLGCDPIVEHCPLLATCLKSLGELEGGKQDTEQQKLNTGAQQDLS